MSEPGQDGQVKQPEALERAWTPGERAMLDALEAGETVEAAAGAMGLSYAGLYLRRQHDPVLDEAVKVSNTTGRSRQCARIAKALYSGAEKVGEDARFTGCAIFALKNLSPAEFRDSHDVNLNQTGDLAARLAAMDPAQALAVGRLLGKSEAEVDTLRGTGAGGGADEL